MNKILLVMTVFILFSASAMADTKQPVKKSGRALEGTVETRIGELAFINGYPSESSVVKLYEEMDFQRAVQAYLWGLPMVEMAEWQKAQKDIFKAGTNDFVTYLDFKQKLGILTANATTPYMMAFPNLKETGPMVFEIPPGPTAGGLLDFWQRPFSDLGQTGPDKGEGAKYLILGPGDPDMNPEGYIVVRSPHWNVFLGHRVLHPDTKMAATITKAHKLYPYSERTDPKPTRFISSAGIDWEAFQSRGLTYFTRLASILEIEPVEPRDYIMMAMLRPLGIMPGVAFAPDARQKAIFEQAAIVGEAMARANSYAKRFEGAQVWEGKHWEKALFISDTDQDLETHTQLDERASWFYEAIGVTDGMMGKMVGAGQVYLEAQKDGDGEWLDGGKAYKISVPPNAPVKQFWSFTVYDNDDRCLIDSGELPDKSSRMDLVKNSDGSVDLYFGPIPPKDPALKKNWVKTVTGEGWFTYFRLYAPTEAYFDGSWQLPDIEKVILN
ncbi:MAG: DUF1254 domain-containing protein [Candidatus Thiodiazotropha taylori]|nr:DUF1254 domain-containing protein [Candidatus Thiodiazotropha taylori]